MVRVGDNDSCILRCNCFLITIFCTQAGVSKIQTLIREANDCVHVIGVLGIGKLYMKQFGGPYSEVKTKHIISPEYVFFKPVFVLIFCCPYFGILLQK